MWGTQSHTMRHQHFNDNSLFSDSVAEHPVQVGVESSTGFTPADTKSSSAAPQKIIKMNGEINTGIEKQNMK